MRTLFLLGAAVSVIAASGAERVFDFESSSGPVPPGFRSIVAGAGKPGDWRIIRDEVPFVMGTSNAAATTPRAVLAQLAREPIETHFPMLIFDEMTFGDFRMTTRFKIAGGALDQMAGLVFRYQNETNFYVVRASALGNNFRCYKVENGLFKPAVGPEMEVTKGVWHTLLLQCEGSRILCALDGNEAIKIVDSSATAPGKIGFWTKSDSVSYFTDAKISYTPHVSLAAKLVETALQDNSRLEDLKIFSRRNSAAPLTVIACKNESDLGQAGGETEENVLKTGEKYYSRGKGTATVTLPLRDRNGDPIAAVVVVLKSFPGQTEDNAVLRALPIVKEMQPRVQSLDNLLE